MEGFDSWLGVKLKSLGTDENVFGDYIKGILEGEESQEEKIEALEGILAEISPVYNSAASLFPLSCRFKCGFTFTPGYCNNA